MGTARGVALYSPLVAPILVVVVAAGFAGLGWLLRRLVAQKDAADADRLKEKDRVDGLRFGQLREGQSEARGQIDRLSIALDQLREITDRRLTRMEAWRDLHEQLVHGEQTRAGGRRGYDPPGEG